MGLAQARPNKSLPGEFKLAVVSRRLCSIEVKLYVRQRMSIFSTIPRHFKLALRRPWSHAMVKVPDLLLPYLQVKNVIGSDLSLHIMT